MKKSHKIGILIITLLPVILVPVIILAVFFGGLGMSNLENPEFGAPASVGIIISLGLLIAVTSLIAWVYFLVHAIQNQELDSNERLLWILLFIFVGFVPQIIYFFMKIWDQPEPN